jgi:hypothetical protein
MHRSTQRRGSIRHRWPAAAAVAAASIIGGATLGLAGPAGAAGSSGASFIAPGTTVTEVGSTIPGNGDVNPYGVAVVQQSVGALVAGDVLVSNFNDGPPPVGNQGLGTTIVELNPDQSPNAAPQVFAQINPSHLPGACPGGVGLTTALSILSGGWVVVGSLPTTNGSTIAGPGCLIVLDSHGNVVETFSGGNINGPWDMTAVNIGPFSELFFTNVLNGTVANGDSVTNGATVVRDILFRPAIGPPHLVVSTVIASGLAERLDPNALVVGPTGLALDNNGALYVADTVNSKIDEIPNPFFRFTSAGTGTTVSSGGDLNGPLGLAATANGDLLAANAGDGNLVALTAGGTQIGEKVITPGGGGSLFGLAVSTNRLFFVDDSENQLNELS